MKKICRFATTDLFQFAKDILNIDCPFESDLEKIEAVIDDEDFDNPETPAGCFLEAVYGDESRLYYEPWAKKCCDKKANWLFDAREIRQKIFAWAKVPFDVK
jgi:hypothetical protein